MNDLRHTLRILLKNPVFTLTGVLALALGIGANTAVFSVVDRILFRSLPYPREERLVSLGLVAPMEPQEFMLARVAAAAGSVGIPHVLKRRQRLRPDRRDSGTRGLCAGGSQLPAHLGCSAFAEGCKSRPDGGLAV